VPLANSLQWSSKALLQVLSCAVSTSKANSKGGGGSDAQGDTQDNASQQATNDCGGAESGTRA
jgi:hypothetical protein